MVIIKDLVKVPDIYRAVKRKYTSLYKKSIGSNCVFYWNFRCCEGSRKGDPELRRPRECFVVPGLNGILDQKFQGSS